MNPKPSTGSVPLFARPTLVAVVSLMVSAVTIRAETATPDPDSLPPIATDVLAQAEQLLGMQFTAGERDSMLTILNEHRQSYQQLRGVPLDNSVPPALFFGVSPRRPPQRRSAAGKPPVSRAPTITTPAKLPETTAELAFYSVRQLAELVRTRQVTAVQLTDIYLERLKRHGPKLECVVTLTEDLARQQAQRADAEIAAGHYRGPLHGIPYGIKDLFAVREYPTTWGAAPYKDQVRDETATVVKKLEASGAVLIAKLTLGALAWGDVWFGGKTRNPWSLEQGSSGSSTGPAAATAAGLVGVALGTGTWGSIVAPCSRGGVTGLRPTFGRVSRTGAMALSWSMDKVGPICRTVDDCALILEAILGPDGMDPTVTDQPFDYEPEIDLGGVRIGMVESLFEELYTNRSNDHASLERLRELGVDLQPVKLPDQPIRALSFILEAEAAAAFDELTRSGRDDLMVRQITWAWPNVFRAARLIPAVEYIQANRARTLLMQEMATIMADVDVYLAPSFGGDNLLLTNLTGHPCVVLPNGFDDDGRPTSISFIGRLNDEATLLAVAGAYQRASGFHRQHPGGFD